MGLRRDDGRKQWKQHLQHTIEIGAEVIGVFEADRQAEDAVARPTAIASEELAFEPEARAHERIGRDPVDEAAVVAKRYGEMDEAELLDQAAGERRTVIDGDAHHAGIIRALPERQLIQ